MPPTGVFSSWLMLATKSVRTRSTRARSLISSTVARAPPSVRGTASIWNTRRGGPKNSTTWPLGVPPAAARRCRSMLSQTSTRVCPLNASDIALRTWTLP